MIRIYEPTWNESCEFTPPDDAAKKLRAQAFTVEVYANEGPPTFDLKKQAFTTDSYKEEIAAIHVYFEA